VAICGYLEPLAAVLFSVFLLRETMSGGQILGAVLIIGGAVFGECMSLRKYEKQTE
jgi:drug/metabolite transporter (DMT)-like permease